jgi:predicted transcriptional regulator
LSDNNKPVDSDLEKAVGIVAAYVSHNSLRASDLPDLITSVHASIRLLAQGVAPTPASPPETPAVPIKKSVTKDYIVCLEDGKKFKSLRRHLSSFHNLTPDQYRAKWGLPSDHPMVAPSYSATRSQLAKDSGLGHVTKEAGEETVPGDSVEPQKKQGRGRPKKTA